MKKAKTNDVGVAIEHIENYLEKSSKTYNETIDKIQWKFDLQNEFDNVLLDKIKRIDFRIYVTLVIWVLALGGVISLALIQLGII